MSIKCESVIVPLLSRRGKGVDVSYLFFFMFITIYDIVFHFIQHNGHIV